MKKYIILLFALCFLSSCKPTVDYEIPSEVETRQAAYSMKYRKLMEQQNHL